MKSIRNTWQFRLTAYMVSQGISLLGSSVVSLAMIWYVTLQTGSGLAVAGVTITTFIPQALVMLFGGVLADKYPPKRIVILADSFIALSTLALAIFFACGVTGIGWIFFFNTLRSLGTGIQLPASKSILSQIVPRDQLMRANSLSTGIWSVIQLVSPGLGGVVMSMMSMEYVFMLDVVTALIGVLILSAIAMPVRTNTPTVENTKEGIQQGFRYIMGSKALRYSIILYTIFQFLVVPASQITPLLAVRNVGEQFWVLSVSETAFSVGALLISLVMVYKKFNIPHCKLISLSAMVFGATMILLLPAKGIVIFSGLMLLMGVGSPLYYTPLITYIQENTREIYMGRTFSYVDMFSSLATPLGMVVFGPLYNVNYILPFVIPGALMILLGIWIGKRM